MTRRLPVVVAITCLAALPGYAQTRGELFERCRDFRGNPDLAVAACTTLIQSGTESDANLSVLFTGRGISRAVLRDYDRALTDFAAAEKLDPRNTSVLFNRGLAYVLLGRMTDAALEARRALEINPDDPHPHLVIAESYRRSGGFVGAADEFERGFSAPLNNPQQEATFKGWQARNQQALRCDGAASDLAAAIEACTAVIADETLTADAVTKLIVQRAVAHRERNDMAAAVADFSEVIRRNDYFLHYASRAEALIELGKYDEAQRDIERSLTLEPGVADTVNLQGVLAHQRRDYPLAIQRFTEAQSRIQASYAPSPSLSALYRAEYLANRGITYLVMGRLEEARRDLDMAIGFRPTQASALYARAVLRSRTGDAAGANTDFAAATKARANIETLMARRGVTR